MAVVFFNIKLRTTTLYVCVSSLAAPAIELVTDDSAVSARWFAVVNNIVLGVPLIRIRQDANIHMACSANRTTTLISHRDSSHH